MAPVRGAVHVLDFRAHGIKGASELTLPGTTDALAHLFRVDAGEGSATEESPQKRRKLNRHVKSSLQPTETFDPKRSVLLADVSLDLHLPKDVEPPTVPAGASSTIAVSMNRFDRIDPTNFSFGLWDASFTKGLAVNATSTSDFLDSFASHFDTAVTLSTSNGKKGTTKPERICFCRCTLSASATGQGSMRLGLEIRWTIGLSVFDTPGQRATMRMELNTLSKYLPEESSDSATAWALSDFYDSVHVPPTTEDIPPRIEEMMNDTQLYPFQRRAISWLLRREGVAYKESGGLSTIEDGAANLTPVSFKATQDASGRSCYVSHLRGMVVTDLDPIQDAARTLRGGILAEEMGLGKTVELLALISHHKRVVPDGKIRDPYLGTLVTPSGATLIITPPSILDQWRQEIATHAPELKVFHYKGLPPPSAPRSEHEEATMNHLSKFDIVLTTYQVLSREIHFATPPPDRSLRHVKVHQRRESPLVQISWWRVCLDEAQMVESGVSQAATVARIIPRCNAWAVSGTPLRKDIQDLRGLLIFLRHEPYAGSKAIWDRLDKASFRDVFNRITLRHTKDKIRAELSLPAQKRVIITVPFTAIEEHNYSGLIGQMCRACYLSQDGLPLRDDRGPDHPEVVERMREWLVRLRQTCLHANVGSRNKKALGAKNGPLRTVDEVLEVMIEQNDTSLKAEARELISCELMRAHVQANAKNIENRSAIALETYEVALKRAQDYVQICRNELALEKKKIGTHSITKDGSDQNSDDEEDDDQADKTGRIAVLRRNLRSFLELEHACHFFIGNMYYQTHSNEKLVKPGSEECQRLERMETEAYDRAKAIRKEILKQPQGRAHGYMKTIKPEAPSCIREIDELPDEGGIESRRILEMMDNVVNVLNAQVGQLREWRSKIVGILTMPLVDQDENKDITGDEYEDSTKVQDELYVYIMALRTITADRNTTVTAVKNELIEHELKEALKTARPRPDNDETKRGHAPELVLEVGRIRHNLMPKESDGTLKGVIAAARSLVTTLQYGADGGDVRAQGELAIVKKHLHRIQAISNEQEKAITELEKEQDLFRATMNQRLEFYRQLQHISDTVAPWREELDEELDQREYNRQVHLIHNREQALAGFKTKLVYLNNLRGENQPGTVHICGICMDDEGFEVGVLTSCGHKFCKTCLTTWWQDKRTCPMCKKKLALKEFTDITLKPTVIKAQEETGNNQYPSQPSSPSSANSSIYSDISDATMKEIKMIDLEGSYGSKVDMIARHLIWLRGNDPGAKSIVFSQFADFLNVLKNALRKWKIGTIGIGDKDGIKRFKSDPAMECFLLDAKSDSSGLNLVNATYVFLCEPLINPAIELQAIARVHRIGQQRATTIFQYLISDTVEEAIYDISVARRLEHMGRTTKSQSASGSVTPALQEKTLDAANSMELEAAPLSQLLGKKNEGEVVLADDLWTCLFGKPRKQDNVVMNREAGRELRAEDEREIRAAAAEHRRAVEEIARWSANPDAGDIQRVSAVIDGIDRSLARMMEQLED